MVFVPIFVFLLHDALSEREQAQAAAVRQIEALIETVNSEYHAVVDEGRQLGAVLQQLGRIREGRVGDCNELLSRIEALFAPFPQIAVTDPTGRIVCSAVPVMEQTTAADRKYFKDAVSQRSFVMSEPLMGRVSKRPVVVLATPYLTDEGAVAGVIIVSLDLDWVRDVFKRFKLPPGSSIGLTTSDGIVAARYPDAEKIAGQSIRHSAFFQQKVAQGAAGTFTGAGLDGVRSIFAFMRQDIHGSDSVLWAGVPVDEVDDPIRSAFLSRVAWLLAGVLALFLVSWRVGQRIFVDPLRALLRAAGRFGSGDLAARSGVKRVSGEIGQLSRAFDDMADRIQRHEQDLRRVNLLLTILSEGNRSMLRSVGEADLLERICSILVKVGGYQMAWVALQSPDGAAGLRAVEGYSAARGRSAAEELKWIDGMADEALRQGAIRDSRAHVDNDVLSARRSPSVCEDASRRGYASWTALPLRSNGDVYGVLGIHAVQASAFGERELELLQETADDVGFGIRLHRLKAQHSEAEEALRVSEERFRLLAEHSRDGMWLMTAVPERLLYVSPAVERIWGRKAEDLCRERRLWVNAVHQEDRARVMQAWQDWLADRKEEYAIEFRILRPDGTLRYIFDYGEKIRGGSGEIRYVAGVSRDLTERKSYEERIRHSATHDELTGLPNRVLLLDLIEHALPAARRAGRHAAVLSLNLDRLKHVNESLGHEVGDAVLRAVAGRLQKQVRPGDTVARLGSDDFTVFLPDLHEIDDAAAVAQKLLNVLSAPIDADGRSLSVAASIGIAIYPGDAEDGPALLRNSDSAMHRVKAEGGGAIGFFTENLGTRVRERLELEQALASALERKELFLHYQPQIDAQTGRMTGVEALLRWARPGVGLVSPAIFIPVAEETGSIVAIGEWVLREAFSQAAQWRAEGLPAIRIAVNISARQFWNGKLAGIVKAALDDSRQPSSLVELEVTEGVVMRDAEETIRSLAEFKSLGLAVSVDDFGTGYSSLAYLRRYPIDRLKIDRSFVRDITEDPRAATLVRGVIGLAHGLGFRVVAEGVESLEQAKLLKLFQCDELQGYYFSKPLAAGDFRSLLQANRVF